MVKIYTKDGQEEKFNSKDVEADLKKAGLPERVAEEVAERVEDKVEDRWTLTQVNQQVDIELKRLEEDIERAHTSFRAETGAATVGTDRAETTRSETFVPEKDTREHKRSIF